MGLFNLFKKNGDNNNEQNPEDQMLTLNERQKPALKSETKPPGLDTAPPPQAQQPAPEVMLTPDPQAPQSQNTQYDFSEEPAPEPQQFARENLSTKSLEKNIQSIPNVKKLVIPSNNEAMEQKVEPTDTVFAERVKLKQVDLGGDKEAPLVSETNFIPGEFIDLPISLLIENIDPQYLSRNATTLFDNTAKIRFTKEEVLSIMAQGAFAVVGSALFARFPAGVASEKGKSTQDVLEFPLDKILTLVPPEWFALQGQDNSLTESLDNMSNPFQDLEAPEQEEKQEEKEVKEEKPASNSLFDNDDEISVEVSEDAEATTLDSLETMNQMVPPTIEEEEDDSLATMVQEKPPVIEEAAPVPAAAEIPVSDDTTLVVPVEAISSALNPETFSNLPKTAHLKIPKERVLSFLAQGAFKLSAQEIDTFTGTSSVSPENASQPVEIDLGMVMALIPPEWFAIQGQDNSQNEILTNMRDVFDDSTFEEAAKELENTAPEENTDTNETVDEAVEIEVEEEESVEIEVEEEEAADSLITGGLFSKMNSLFEDDEEEEESVEIEVEEEEEITAGTKPLLEEESKRPQEQAGEETKTATVGISKPIEVKPPITEQVSLTPPAAPTIEVKPPVTEQAPLTPPAAPTIEVKPPITEQASLTPPAAPTIEVKPPVTEEIKPPTIEEAAPIDSLQTITINRADDKTFDDQRESREQAKELEKQVEQAKEQALNTAPESHPSSAPPNEPSVRDEENQKIKDAGQVTYRPIADEAPELTDKSELRPSTAPNGIDVNRSNLKDLCRLHSAGEKLAQTLIKYREENGDFKSINELINVPGVGTSVYRSLTGLRPSADLVGAERRINKIVGLSTDKDYPLGKVITEAQTKFDFKSIILSDKDGFEICSSGDKSLLESNSELLAATTPQLFKKTRHFLKQSNLPHPQIFTFYLEDTPVTFGIADEVFMVMVHSSKWPEPKHMKQCRELINEMAWFCSYRAIV